MQKNKKSGRGQIVFHTTVSVKHGPCFSQHQILLFISGIGMSKQRVVQYSEVMYETKLPMLKRELPAPKSLSKLERMRNQYQERVSKEKEEKLLTLFTKQQEHTTQKVHGSSLHTEELRHNPRSNFNVHHNPPSLYTAQWPEEKNWASNWIVSKRSAGVDRAHPLKPVFHPKDQRSVRTETSLYRSQSASSAGNKLTIPHPEEHIRLKSGPSRPEVWFQLQNSELSLEAEIRRKKALLKEKLRRTEEELRRIQREKEVAELEDTTVQGIPERNRTMGKLDEQVGKYLHNLDFTLKAKEKSSRHFRNQNLMPKEKDPQTNQEVPNNMTEKEQPVYRGRSPQYAANFKEEEKRQMPKDVPQDDAPEPSATELLPCNLCGRQFLAHRLEKHTQVCQKMQKSNRKVFDSSKARAKGTELEQYLQTKGKTRPNVPKVQSNAWRQKHESFQQTIRHARTVQQVIAKGGKLSDLPPPPPEENPDYVTCPHCNRRFAPRVAERHIPKCENIKSKPRPLRRR
uniref:Zinc finger, C2HC-type-containing 1C n=1 Tax=Xenopus tropicalis TaxID=8364 RepID=F6YVM0_XENTR